MATTAAPPTAATPGQPADRLADALGRLRARFRPEAAAGLEVTYAFELAGAGGGSFWLRVAGERLESGLGAPPAPADAGFRLDADDFFDLLAGRANADMLFMEDRLAIDGDLSLALRLRRLFPRPA